MPYRGYTETVKRNNAKYDSQFCKVTLRLTEKEKIKLIQMAKREGVSIARYCKEKIFH